MAVLKYDKVVLTKELNNKMNKVGETYEIASVSEDSFVLRDAKNKVALGVVSLEEFNKYFTEPQDIKGWTKWISFVDEGGNTAFYRTNFRKVEVKAWGKRASAICNLAEDEFNLYFGMQIAYCRCMNKALIEKRNELQNSLKIVNSNIKDNRVYMRNMINSLIDNQKESAE